MWITLRDEGTTAVIDSLGAQLISLQDSCGREYIWQRDPEYWDHCSPVLFPVVGNCRNDRTILEGEVFSMMKHGFCRDKDFTVSEAAETSATFEITDDEETKACYPYAFCLSISYELTGKALSVSYQVANRDKKTMYYCLGAHPGFNCPIDEGELFNDYMLEFEEAETAYSMVYDLEKLCFDPERRILLLDDSKILPLSKKLFKNDAIYFDTLDSRRVALRHEATGRGVEVSFPGFETVAFWTPCSEDAPFICIEPWNGSAVYSNEDDEFIHKNHVQNLEAEKSRIHKMVIRLI